MGNLLAVLKVVMSLLTTVGDLVKAVEIAVPVGSQGAQKLEMVRGMISGAFSAIEQTEVSFEQVWPVIKPVIDNLVAIYKATGVFAPKQ